MLKRTDHLRQASHFESRLNAYVSQQTQAA